MLSWFTVANGGFDVTLRSTHLWLSWCSPLTAPILPCDYNILWRGSSLVMCICGSGCVLLCIVSLDLGRVPWGTFCRLLAQSLPFLEFEVWCVDFISEFLTLWSLLLSVVVYRCFVEFIGDATHCFNDTLNFSFPQFIYPLKIPLPFLSCCLFFHIANFPNHFSDFLFSVACFPL